MLAALILLCASSSSFSKELVNQKWEIKPLSFLQAPNTQGFQTLLQSEGLFALTNIPGFAEARVEALSIASECPEVAPVTVDLQDGSKRFSFANEDLYRCPGLEAPMKRLQSSISLATEWFLKALDDSMVYKVFDKGISNGINSFAELQMEHLDHLHVYAPASNDNSMNSLDFHLDHGMFIALVPSLRVGSSGNEDSFYLEMNDDQFLASIPENSLVFMIGNGIRGLTPYSVRPMRPVPHAVKLPFEQQSLRVWMGRMFFLEENKQVMEQVVKHPESVSSFGCHSSPAEQASSFRQLTDYGVNCTAGTAYCWMSCSNITTLACSVDDVVCVSATTGTIWVDCPTCHDMTASNQCRTESPTASPTDSLSIKVNEMFGMVFMLIVSLALM